MKPTRLTATALLAAAHAFGATGCASEQEKPEEAPAEAAEEGAQAEDMPAIETPAQSAASACHAALTNPSFFFEPEGAMSASGDPAVWNGIEIARVVLHGTEEDTLIDAGHDIQIRVAGAGGYRGSPTHSAYGDGLLHSEFSTGTGEGETKRITVDGHRVDETFVAPISIGRETAAAAARDRPRSACERPSHPGRAGRLRPSGRAAPLPRRERRLDLRGAGPGRRTAGDRSTPKCRTGRPT